MPSTQNDELSNEDAREEVTSRVVEQEEDSGGDNSESTFTHQPFGILVISEVLEYFHRSSDFLLFD